MAEDVAAGDTVTQNQADDRTLLDDLTVLAQPAAAAPQAGEARQAQEGERAGGVVELATIHQGTPDLGARFVPAAPDLAGAKDGGEVVRAPDAGANGAIAGIDNAKPTGPFNTPRADGSEAVSTLTLTRGDDGHGGATQAPAPAALTADTAPVPAAAAAAPTVTPAAATAGAAPAAVQAAAATEHAQTNTAATTATTTTEQVVSFTHVGTPTLTAQGASGVEDQANPIPLTIQVGTTDAGDSISSVVITGVHDAILNHGTNIGGGSWQLSAADLNGLALIPNHNFGGETLTLGITATAVDGGLSATSTSTISVNILAVADQPTLTVSAASGTEDNWVNLSITSALTDTDGSERLSHVISGVPSGAQLSAGTYDAATKTWSLTTEQLSGLKILPASHDAHDFKLTVTSTATETGPDNLVLVRSATNSADIQVTVDGVAHVPNETVSATLNGIEDTRTAIDLNLSPFKADEVLSNLTVSGVPTGSHFYTSASGASSLGTDNHDGTWTFTQSDITAIRAAGLYVQAPQDWNDSNSSGGTAGMTLTAAVTASETDPDSGHLTTATTTQNFTVHVAGVADKPTVTLSAATTSEETPVALTITPHLTDVTNTEAISAVTISGVPTGASLNHGHNNGDGSWTLSSADLTGLTITPPAHSAVDFTLTVTATSTEQGSNVSVLNAVSDPVTLKVTVDGVAHVPTETVSASLSGNEDSRIAVNLTLATTKADESLSGLVIAATSGSDAANVAAVAGSTFTTGTGASVGTYDAVNHVWSFSATDVAAIQGHGLYVQPPHDWSDWSSSGHNTGLKLSATLTASETDPDSGHITTASTTQSTVVHVAGVADAPTVTAGDVAGSQNTGNTGWINLSITPALSDTDGSESISALTITGVPTGAALSAGTHNSDGSWTLTQAQLSGLKIQPAAHDSGDFTIYVTATSTEAGPNVASGLGSATSAPVAIHVAVEAVAEAPTVTQSTAVGNEDTRINVQLSLGTTDAAETLTGMTLGGVVTGSAFYSAASGGTALGTDNHDGTWSFSATDLSAIKAGGLFVLPPSNWSDWNTANHTAGMQMTASVTASKTDADSSLVHTSTTTQALTVNVSSVADQPTAMTTVAASGTEFHGNGTDWIPLSISAPALTDTDGSETLAVTITGVPTGALLSAGTHNSDGSWSLSPAQLSGLSVQPASHDAKDFTLTITATSTEGGVASHIATATASTSSTLVVSVTGIADAPILAQTATAVGNEDTRISLNLNAQLTDSNEALGMTLSGVPSGSAFYDSSSGGNAVGSYAGGVWTFSTADMAKITASGHNLYVLPPKDWSDWNTAANTTGMQLSATLTSTETDPDTGAKTTASTPLSFGVEVKSVADAPTLTTGSAHGSEFDGSTPDGITLPTITTAVTDTDGSESISSVTISAVPNGAKLALSDGTVLSATTIGATTSTYTLNSTQLAGLKLQPATHDAHDITLSVTSTSTEDGVASHIAVGSASTTATLKVTVDGVADAPTIAQTNVAVGDEDTRINLNLNPQLTDSNEALSMTLSGVPSGSAFYDSASGGNAVGTYANGVWTFSSADMGKITAAGHSLYVLPPSNWSDWNTTNHTTGMQLTATLTSTETDPDSNAKTSASAAPITFGVEVKSVADVPVVTVTNTTIHQNDGTGAAGNWVALSINPAVTDTDGSETISAVTISQVPNGAQLALADGTVLSATTIGATTSSYTLTNAQLAGLKILPPAHSATDFQLSVTATSTEGGDPAHISVANATSGAQIISVTVTGTAEAANVGQSTAAVGLEDHRINVNLSVVLPDSHEAVTGITMTGVPTGSVFYASADTSDSTKLGHYDSSTGTWSFTAAEVAVIGTSGHGLYIQPPNNWSDWNTSGHTTGMQLVTKVSVTETDPDTQVVSNNSTTQTLAVEVKSVADAPTVSASAARGNEDGAIALNITPHLTDTDGSESISALTITGVPTGAVLNHGHDNGDGSWTLAAGDLTGLTITPPAFSKTAFTLHVTATSTEGGDAAHIDTASATSTVVDLKVTVDAVADTPTVTVHDASGLEDQWVSLNLGAATPDTSGTEVVTLSITGMPSGAILNHGTYNAATGAWTVAQADLADLKVLPPADNNADFTLHAQAITTEPSDGSTNHSGILDFKVTVTGQAEAPNVTETAQGRGLEDTRIDLHLTGSLTDANEALSLTLSGIPTGSHFYCAATAHVVGGADSTAIGTDNHDGTWSFSTIEVAAIKAGGLFLQPPTDWSDWSSVGTPSSDWSVWNPGQGGIQVTATLTSTDTDVDTQAKTTADTQINFTVHVTGVADAANGLPAGDFVATAAEDGGNTRSGTLVDLGFGQLSLKDADGSEHLSVVVSNLPNGTKLVFTDGQDHLVPIGAGKWSIDAQYLSSARLLVPENHNLDTDGTLHLNAAVVTTEVDGNVHVDNRVVDVTVSPVTDAAHIAGGGRIAEDSVGAALPLSVSAGGIGETVDSVTLNLTAAHGVGAKVYYDGSEITADSYTVAGTADLSKFTITTPSNWSDWSSANHTTGITIGVSVVSHDHEAAPLTTTQTIAMHVSGVADAPGFSALSAVAIGPDHGTTVVAFDVASKVALSDTDGSERLSMQIDGLPDGALLVTGSGTLAGYNEGGGKWLVTADEWDAAVKSGGFHIAVPGGISDQSGNAVTSANVTVRAVSTEQDDNSSANTTQSFTLTWDGSASGAPGGASEPTAPTITVAGGGTASGNEDSAIALGIAIGAHGADQVATLVVDAASLNGGTLSAGIYDSTRNVWLVQDSDIAGLKLTPAHNWNSAEAGTDLSITSHVVLSDITTGGTTSVAVPIQVHVNPVTDAASVSGHGSGLEDTAIALNLGVAAGGIAETVTAVVISNVPAGAHLRTAEGVILSPDTDGGTSYTVSGLGTAELAGLKLVPPANWSDYSGSITLDVAVTTQDHGAAAVTVHGSVPVHVTGVTDLASISTAPAHGTENQWVDLSSSLHAALTDTDGSEGISIVLAGVPDGAVLNHGFNNGDGSWRLDAADLPTLKILMPTDFNGQQTMTLQALTWEKDGSDGLKTATASVTVTVDAAAETPSVSVTSARGNEDSAIALTISADVVHALGSDHIDHVTIAGMPAGAVLNHGHDNGDGSWTLAAGDLNGLTITPPSHSDVAFTLQVTATAAETDSSSHAVATTTSAVANLAVKIDAVANGGTATVTDAGGSENSWIDLSHSISPALIDTDGSETITGIVITGMPAGAVLNHGVHNADGSWSVAPADLSSLKVMAAANSAADFTLSASVVTTESANGASASGPAASFHVTVGAVATPVTFSQSAPSAGNEDSRISLNLSAVTADPNESATLTLTGVPAGSHLYDAATGGTAIGTVNTDGSWTVSPTEMAALQSGGGSLYIQPPSHWSDWSSTGHNTGLQLTATVTGSVTDPDTQAVATTSSSLSFAVHVAGVADAPTVAVADAHGSEDGWINLAINPALVDTTGSEYISAVTITGVPTGATLNHGVQNADGSWTLQQADLTGLQVKGASHDAHDFTLTVTATSHDWQTNANSALDTATSAPVTIGVTVDGVAYAPNFSQTAASAGNEDTRINLNLSASLNDAGEALTLTMASVPVGSHFYAAASGGAAIGTDTGNGTWSFTTAEVSQIQSGGLYIQPPADWSDWNTSGHNTGMQLAASLISTTTDPDTGATTSASSSQSFTVHVASVADAPSVSVTDTTTTVDAPVALSITPVLADTDGSESISAVTITGVPTGATLNHGTHNADGSWTLTEAQLSGLTLTPANQDAHDLTLHVTATSTEAAGNVAAGLGSATSASFDLHVGVSELAHAPILALPATVSGAEDSLIGLNLSAALAGAANGHESLSLSLSGLSGDFSFVTQAGGGSIGSYDAASGNWTFSASEIAQTQASGHGLYLEPPANWSDWNTTDHAGLTLTATLSSTTAIDPDTNSAATAISSSSATLHVASVADTPSLTATGVIGTSGEATPLSISSALSDTDGSESLKLTVTGLTADETLNHGTHNADGTWTLTGGDLSGLSISAGSNDAGASTLHVTATSTEALGGSTASISADFSLKLNSADLGSTDAADSHLLHFDHLPTVSNGTQLAEFVFGSLDGVHNLDVSGVTGQPSHSLVFDDGVDHVAIAAGAHGFIDSAGIHTVTGGTETVQHLDPNAFLDTSKIHAALTFDNSVVLHVEGLDKISF